MRFWRFFLGAGIGMGLGYALVLLLQPTMAQKKPAFRTVYQATPQREEEHTAA